MVQRSGSFVAAALAIGCWAAAGATIAARPAGEIPGVLADPAIRSGQLPNGLRYLILHNATPTGQGALWLRVDAGSLQEGEGQAGAAHFIEHLAFDGSKGVSGGELVKLLKGADLTFAADSDGAVDYDATTYRFDLPKTDDATVGVALRLLRETASELTLSPAAISQERGTLLAEARESDTPAHRLFEARLAFLLKGQRPPDRSPLASTKAIETLKRGELEAFYQRYYRPERAIVIAVGDFDPGRMEGAIRARFSAWRGVGAAGGDPALGPVEPRGAETHLAVEDAAPTSLQVAWIAPPDGSPDSADRRRRNLIERIALAVLNARLETLASTDAPAFLTAAAFRVDEFHAARVTSLLVTADPDRWQAALAAAILAQRRSLAEPIDPDELASVATRMESDLKDAVASAGAQESSALAGGLADCGLEACASPAQELALFEETVRKLSPQAVSAALRDVFEGGGPLLYMTSPTPIDGGEAAIQAEFVKDLKAPLAPP